MPEATPPTSASVAESEAQGLWEARRLPPPSGILGPPEGTLVRQFEGTCTAGDAPVQVAHRAVVADIDARYLALSGRRVVGVLREEPAARGASETATIPNLLSRLGVWVGGSKGVPWEGGEESAGVQSIASRLAQLGVLVARDAPMRVCLHCGAPRSPERIIYQQEIGDTLLVRFPLVGNDSNVHALVWVDAPWRLLGTSALLVHPDLPYVTVDYRRRDATATLLTSRSSLDRLRAWLPDIELEVREERPGKELIGRPYAYPLRHEFPMGGTLEPPAGTIQAVPDVGDSGTGIVPLVPGHGGTDAQIAERLGVTGWPLLSARGVLDLTLMHKYSGLDLETANEFVDRDLVEGGSVFARLRVMRGVPYCGVCGHRLFWLPGRAWCLEPGHLPPEGTARYARLLPRDPPIAQIEVAPWAASELAPVRAGETGVTLLECNRCARLDAPAGPPQCPCGGRRRAVTRRLLPSLNGACAAWASAASLSRTDSFRFYLDERRRSPALVHQLAAMAGRNSPGGEVALSLVPTLGLVPIDSMIERFGVDAVRAALLRAGAPEGRSTPFEEWCRQEGIRLERLRALAAEVIDRCDPATLAAIAQPLSSVVRELEIEDRGILARWARSQLRAMASFDAWSALDAYRELARFVDGDLAAYREMVRPRLEASAAPASRRGALRTLAHLLRSLAVGLAPVAPFTAEAVRRRFVGEPRSVFEGVDLTPDRGLLDEGLQADWERWRAIERALDQFRRDRRIPPSQPLPSVAISVATDEVARRLQNERAAIERAARIGRLEIGGPGTPWERRVRRVVPVEPEIQRVYPSIAPQVLHLLRRLPARRPGEGQGRELSVVVQGIPRAITPAMVTYVDQLPDRFVATPFALGEMYVELPTSGAASGAELPPLSPDAFWLVRRTRQRLRRFPPPSGGPGRVALVVAVDPLATELREKAAAVARHLGLAAFRVIDRTEEPPPRGRITGRTHAGSPWWVQIPGAFEEPHAAKRPRARGTRRRAPAPGPSASASAGEVDFADEAVVAQAQTVRDLGQELDTLLGVPLLGPSKVALAWDAGYRRVSDFAEGPFDQLASLPGFGWPVAGALWTRLGRAPPERARRPAPRPSAAAAPRTLSPPSPPAALPPTAAPLALAVPPGPRPVGAARVSSRPFGAPEPPPAVIAMSAPAAAAETVLPLGPARPPEAAPPSPEPEPPLAVTPEIAPSAEAEESAPAPGPEASPTSAEGSGTGAPEVTPVPVADLAATPSSEVGPSEPAATAGTLPPVATGPTPADTAESQSDLHRAPERGIVPGTAEGTVATAEPVTPGEGLAEVPPAVDLAPEVPAVEPAVPEPEPEATPAGVPGERVPNPDGERPFVPEPEVAPSVGDTPVAPAAIGGEEAPPPVSSVAPPESGTAPPAPEPAAVAEGTPPVEAGGSAIPPTTSRTDDSFGGGAPVAPLEGSPDAGEVGAPPAPEGAQPPEAAPESSAEPVSAGEVGRPAPEEVLEPSPLIEPPSKAEPPAPDSAPPGGTPAPPPPEVPVGPEAPEPAAPGTLAPPAGPSEGAPELPVSGAPIGPPVPEPIPPPPVGLEFDTSESLLQALLPFLDATAAGHKGIAIVRELPERIRAHVGIRPVEVYWLTNLGRPQTLRPGDLAAIVERVRQALLEESVSALFLEGVEYLVRIHGVDRVVEFLRELDGEARAREARLWVHLTPALLSPGDLERLHDAWGGAGGSARPADPSPEPDSR
jgi:hypothetical protein